MNRKKAVKNPLQLIDRKHLAVLLGVIFILTLISVISIVLIVSVENRETLERMENRQQREEKALISSTGFGLEDFYLDIRDTDVGIVYPVRDPVGHWDVGEVEKYWISPSEAGISTLSSDNDKKIFQSLGVTLPDGSDK